MKSYYIDPLSGKKSDSPSDLSSLNDNRALQGLITFVVEADNPSDLAVECIKDSDVKSIYINAVFPDKKIVIDDNLKKEIEDLIPRVVETNVADSYMEDKDQNRLSIINVTVENYQRMPLLNEEELTMRIYKLLFEKLR
ncbi:MAG: hypothetical protein J6Y02_04730 [Pseudobutyrivibrio sp.]|nr:hypothetical protein [Pseudobutyrivibrio sp.]